MDTGSDQLQHRPSCTCVVTRGWFANNHITAFSARVQISARLTRRGSTTEPGYENAGHPMRDVIENANDIRDGRRREQNGTPR